MQLDKPNQKIFKYKVYKTIDKLPFVDFFYLMCILLIFVSDWECFFTKFNKLLTMLYFLFLLLLSWS